MSATLLAIDDLIHRASLALDDKNWNDWLDCFADDGQYFAHPADDYRAGRPLALMMDDCKARIQDRISYIRDVWVYEDYQTRHFTQRMRVQESADRQVDVLSNFTVYFSSEQGDADILCVGQYQDRIDIGETVAKFRRRRAIIDNFLLPRYLVFPV